jgi:type II secretory pathway pseudopilin PulG
MNVSSFDGHSRRCSLRAMTLIEVLVIICVIAILASMLPVSLSSAKPKAQRLACVNNLKNIGVAYRYFPGPQGEAYPASEPIKRGGWKDYLKTPDQGVLTWTNYLLLSLNLPTNVVYSPKTLVCPADDRLPAHSFATLHNTNISYFVGAGADENYPNSLLGGDRNLGSGTPPTNDYGFSPIGGLGNDVILQTNSQVRWSLKIHSHGNTNGAGNILLGDGSVQQCTSFRLMSDYMINALDGGNFPAGYTNNTNSFRLLFP